MVSHSGNGVSVVGWVKAWVVASWVAVWTVGLVEDRDAQGRLLPTPFVSSFVGRARDGDVHDSDPVRRSAAWARWAVARLGEFRGLSDREYAALRLPGRFHDPLGTGPSVPPHLEIPARVLERADAEFPDRLSVCGNALEFPWWLVSEVTAVRRAIFNVPRGSVMPLVETLYGSRGGLAGALGELTASAREAWSVVEGLLVTDPAGLVSLATADIETDELVEHFPSASEFGLRVLFDGQLRESNGMWVARRLGVWQLRGEVDGRSFGLGVVTPRLTPNSLFADPLFEPAREAAGAALVRGVLMRRFAKLLESPVPDAVAADAVSGPVAGVHLRAVPARVGAKLPEASVESAVLFLQSYPDVREAWAALERWALTGYLLTVSEAAFSVAHGNALRLLRRAETPVRDDINVLLPLAWDAQSRVVRVTFARSSAE